MGFCWFRHYSCLAEILGKWGPRFRYGRMAAQSVGWRPHGGGVVEGLCPPSKKAPIEVKPLRYNPSGYSSLLVKVTWIDPVDCLVPPTFAIYFVASCQNARPDVTSHQTSIITEKNMRLLKRPKIIQNHAPSLNQVNQWMGVSNHHLMGND